MFAEEPVAVASVAWSCAESIPAPNAPTIPSAEIFSPFWNTTVVLSEPVATYFTYSVIGSVVVAATAWTTSATTPLAEPVIFFPTKSWMYVEISVVSKSPCSLTA